MNDIRDWFNSSKDYAVGVALYDKYGADATMKKVFSEKESPYKYKLLEKSLDGILESQSGTEILSDLPHQREILPIQNVPDIAAHHPVQENKRWPERLDEVLTALINQWKPLFAEMMNLSNRVGDVALQGLDDTNKKEEAGRMALRILELDDLCDDIYKQREYYLKHHQLPVIEKYPVEIALDEKLWPTRLANHQRYIRDYKSKLKKDPSNTQIATTLKKHQWAVRKYKELMHISDS